MKLIGVPEAADRLSCSKSHVYDLLAAGLLTRRNISARGRSFVRIAEEDLERYMAEAVQPVVKAS
jgi:excisionase family DNA binding protein